MKPLDLIHKRFRFLYQMNLTDAIAQINDEPVKILLLDLIKDPISFADGKKLTIMLEEVRGKQT